MTAVATETFVLEGKALTYAQNLVAGCIVSHATALEDSSDQLRDSIELGALGRLACQIGSPEMWAPARDLGSCAICGEQAETIREICRTLIQDDDESYPSWAATTKQKARVILASLEAAR